MIRNKQTLITVIILLVTLIVVDVAISEPGERIFLLAQSYMPAQEIHILKNPNDSTLGPWYSTHLKDGVLATPEWTFSISDLNRFNKNYTIIIHQ